MDGPSQLDTLGTLLDKVAKKQKVETVPQQLDQMLAILHEWQDNNEDDKSRAMALAALGSRLEAVGVAQSEESTGKELQSSINKLGKSIDKAFPQQQDLLMPFQLEDQYMIESIYTHFLLEGRFELAQTLEGEAQIPAHLTRLAAPLRVMHKAVDGLRQGHLEHALAWVGDHRSELEARASPLPFMLLRLAFIVKLERGETELALELLREDLMPVVERFPRWRQLPTSAHVLLPSRRQFALPDHEPLQHTAIPASPAKATPAVSALSTGKRTSIAQVAPSRMVSIRQLLGALAFAPNLHGTVYEWLVHPSRIDETCEVFVAEAHASLDLPLRSPLAACVEAGVHVLPRLAKLSSILGSKYTETWKVAGELPVELELPGRSGIHHSIFSCPVSKEPATPGNPPMLLPCGHVLAYGSLNKLGRGSKNVRFKCPYCPMEATMSMAKVLHL